MNELKKIIVEELERYRAILNCNSTMGKVSPEWKIKCDEKNNTVSGEIADNIIDKLPSLKDEQIITEDRIIEVLKDSFEDWSMPLKFKHEEYEIFMKSVAKQILKGQKWEVVGKGEVTRDIPDLDIYFINCKQVNSLFKKFNGKNIEVVARKGK